MAEHCSCGSGARLSSGGSGWGTAASPSLRVASAPRFIVLDANRSAQGCAGLGVPRGPSAGWGRKRVTAVAGPGCAGDLPVSAPLSVIPALGCSRRCRIDGARMEVAFTRCHGCQYRQPGSRPSGRRVRVRDAPAAPAPGGDAEPGPGCCTPPGVHLPLAPQLRHPLLCNSATIGAKQDRDRDGTWLRLHLQSGGFGAHSPARLTFSRLKKGNSPPIKRL